MILQFFVLVSCAAEYGPPTIQNENQTITISKNEKLKINLSHIYSNTDVAKIISNPSFFLQNEIIRKQTSITYNQYQHLYEYQPILDFVGTVFVEIKSDFYYRDGPIDHIIYTKYQIIIEP